MVFHTAILSVCALFPNKTYTRFLRLLKQLKPNLRLTSIQYLLVASRYVESLDFALHLRQLAALTFVSEKKVL